jgi:S-methylmethionine-dependent homocysteine/selenocysteine methylase
LRGYKQFASPLKPRWSLLMRRGYVTLEQRLQDGVVILDGAMGTELQRRGAPVHDGPWSAIALDTHPNQVRAVHEDYLRAGADVLVTNSFAASRGALAPVGLGGRAKELNYCSVKLAREAIASIDPPRHIWVAGSVASLMASGSDKTRLRPDAARASYGEQMELLAEAGVDVLALEMISDVDEGCIMLEAARSTGLPVWVGFNCFLSDDGGSVRVKGRSKEIELQACIDSVLASGPCSLVAIMHSDIKATTEALPIVTKSWAGPVACYPENGEWEKPIWRFGEVTPDMYVSAACHWIDEGVQVVGGCCGIGPEHVGLLADCVRTRNDVETSALR